MNSISKTFFWIYIALVLPLNLVSHFFGISSLEFITKPLLMPLLMLVFSFSTKGLSSSLKIGVFGALFFSWIGDVALLYDDVNPYLFIVGLIGFLIAHLHYVFVFIKSNKDNGPSFVLKKILIPLFVIYTLGFIYSLWPYLGELKIAVVVYATVLMFMGVFATLRKISTGFYFVLFGAILFVISDSVLAFNKFHTPFGSARILTMLTYGIAQLLIVLGLSKFINSKT